MNEEYEDLLERVAYQGMIGVGTVVSGDLAVAGLGGWVNCGGEIGVCFGLAVVEEEKSGGCCCAMAGVVGRFAVVAFGSYHQTLAEVQTFRKLAQVSIEIQADYCYSMYS